MRSSPDAAHNWVDVYWRYDHEESYSSSNAAVLGSCGQRIGSTGGGHQPRHGCRNGRSGGRGPKGRCCRVFGGAAVAGPVGALVGAPLGLAAGAVAGTGGAVGAVAGGLVGAPYAVAGGIYNYCPAGYTPVTPPNTLPPNITGVGYCQPLVAPVAYTQPVTTRVAYGAPRRAGARVAYAYPRRALARRVAYRTRAYGYRRVGFRTGPALGYRRVGFRTRAAVGYRQVGFRTSRAFRAQRVGFRTGQAQGRMGAMNRARAY